jgi:3-phenylpropionate/cinnamic acid dioxygenase small subunit
MIEPASTPTERMLLLTAVGEFLSLEAELIDGGRFDEWLELLADDLEYQVPVRLTRERATRHDISTEMFHLDETKATLRIRIERLKTEFAWAEDPPSRTRHFVSNIRVRQLSQNEVEVRSNVLIYRNRGSDASHDLLSGERRDLLRRDGDGWKLARRCVVLDQATIGTRNLGIFL